LLLPLEYLDLKKVLLACSLTINLPIAALLFRSHII